MLWAYPITEVQSILDSKIHYWKLKYLVSWVGDWSPSWEPAEFLEHVPEVIQEFHKKFPLKPGLYNLNYKNI